jgi:hypothetical protein
MAIDSGSVLGQVDNINSKLAEYFSNLLKFVEGSSSLVFAPDFREYVALLDYSEVYRMATTRYQDSASFENGAAIENIHMVVAITREFSLRSKGKLEYYSDARSDYMSESNYYSTMQVFWTSMIKGNYVEGKTS